MAGNGGSRQLPAASPMAARVYCRRQLLANAAIAASRVASYPCVGGAVPMIAEDERPYPRLPDRRLDRQEDCGQPQHRQTAPRSRRPSIGRTRATRARLRISAEVTVRYTLKMAVIRNRERRRSDIVVHNARDCPAPNP
jgi:hypothetical protein